MPSEHQVPDDERRSSHRDLTHQLGLRGSTPIAGPAIRQFEIRALSQT
ncbi:Uncharacterised protein [Mycobacteroides abscessus subsp. abscessus]|nr:Uncharacterised protein [Mycobacteroides abscessus subsp. abscessus]